MDAFLFDDQLAATIERNLMSNIYAYRPFVRTKEPMIWIRESSICESLAAKKIVVLPWDIKVAFGDIPNRLVIRSIANIEGSAQTIILAESYLRAQSHCVQISESKSNVWINGDRRIGQRLHISDPVFNVASIILTSKEQISSSVRYSDDELELVAAESSDELKQLSQPCTTDVPEWRILV